MPPLPTEEGSEERLQSLCTMKRKAVSRLFYYISIASTATLAAITLAGAFATSISPSQSTLLPFIGLALPVLLLLNLAVALYWTARRRYWLFLPLIAILGNWAYITHILHLPASSETPAVDVLTIATYNVDSFNREPDGTTCKNIASYMRSQKADILCFQELGINSTFTSDSVKAAFADWKYSLIPYTADSLPLLQLALFSNYPIRQSKLLTYPDSRNCSLWCDLEVNGQLLRVFNNHLQTTEVNRNKRKLLKVLKEEQKQDEFQPKSRQEFDRNSMELDTRAAVFRLLDGLHQNFIRRAAQAETLQRLIDATPHPTLVCGDFNSLPSSYTYATLKGTRLNDGFQTCGHGYMYTYRYFKHLLRIDYILHSLDIEGVDYFSPELEYSDHNPVVMRVRMR